jgi:TetR/AcrR family tetracycline transcriptional repressor
MSPQVHREIRRRGKGLSRQTIAAAAVAAVETQGFEGLSMRKVAAALGVKAMSLYGYVANKQDLMVAMIDWVMAGVGSGPDTDDAVADALDFAHQLRSSLIAHPNTARLFAMNMSLQDSFAVQALTAKALLILSRLGRDLGDATYTFGLCLSFVTGAVLLEAAIVQSGGPGPEIYDPEEAFDRGIRLLLSQAIGPTQH